MITSTDFMKLTSLGPNLYCSGKFLNQNYRKSILETDRKDMVPRKRKLTLLFLSSTSSYVGKISSPGKLIAGMINILISIPTIPIMLKYRNIAAFTTLSWVMYVSILTV